VVSVRIHRPIEPFYVFALSDIHLESPYHQRDRLIDDLEDAKAHKARILIGGDIWSHILPTDKKRYTASQQIKKVDALVDYAVDLAFDVFLPYVDYIDLLCEGNHEANVIKYHHTDPVNNLRAKLQSKRDPSLPHIRHGGYSGFIDFCFNDGKHHCGRDVWYYHHGKGGGAPVTRGMIDLYRMRAENVADVYWTQHKHTNPSDIPTVRRLDNQGNIVEKEILSFHTAGYEGSAKQQTYEKRGYKTSYGEEKFYHATSTGCAKIVYNVKYGNDGGVKIKKTLIKETGWGDG